MSSIFPKAFCGQVVDQGQRLEMKMIVHRFYNLSRNKWRTPRPCTVQTHSKRPLWYNYLNQHHYLGLIISFFWQLHDLIVSEINPTQLVCRLFSSLARRMLVECNDDGQKRNLQLIIKHRKNDRRWRMAWKNERHGKAVKNIFLYPLTKNGQQLLMMF